MSFAESWYVIMYGIGLGHSLSLLRPWVSVPNLFIQVVSFSRRWTVFRE